MRCAGYVIACGVALAIVAIYAMLLARIERITPRSILRTVRGVPEEPR